MDSTQHYNLTTNYALRRRYKKTLEFILPSLNPGDRILDLGIRNPFSEIMAANGFHVENTSGENLDELPESVAHFKVEVITAFEIFEHLINPLGVLKQLPATRLFASVPLSLWFASAYRHPSDLRDRHFHEFEDWQFDWLLDAGGWKIIRSEKWTSPISRIGVRPLFRFFTPRYYIVEAVRK